jgi:hypothetical protein
MPYIDYSSRALLNCYSNRMAIKPGELNYQMSQLIRSYIAMRGLSYTTLNDIAGVLSCLSMEVYRRITAKYEDEKMSENGDVF